ncbi:hypothetical protein PRVXT_002762 [Proteinivorax tanatarense]|uniref:Uncharacterized protein n=1 Tax=Proteinivorax tanatarense TaxID=1260629 RepID=A0AAU7VKR2_9FIRM
MRRLKLFKYTLIFTAIFSLVMISSINPETTQTTDRSTNAPAYSEVISPLFNSNAPFPMRDDE